MSECAHGTKAFKDLSLAQRIEVGKLVIGIVKRRAEVGIAVSVNQQQYESILPEDVRAFIGDAYTWCLRTCLTGVSDWCQKYQWSGKAAYIFESGHASQPLANRVFEEIHAVPAVRGNHRYASHAFVGKKDACGLQAADLLAWHWARDQQRKRHQRRLDFDNLLGLPHTTLTWSKDLLEKLRSFSKFRGTYISEGGFRAPQDVLLAWLREHKGIQGTWRGPYPPHQSSAPLIRTSIERFVRHALQPAHSRPLQAHILANFVEHRARANLLLLGKGRQQEVVAHRVDQARDAA